MIVLFFMLASGYVGYKMSETDLHPANHTEIPYCEYNTEHTKGRKLVCWKSVEVKDDSK